MPSPTRRGPTSSPPGASEEVVGGRLPRLCAAHLSVVIMGPRKAGKSAVYRKLAELCDEAARTSAAPTEKEMGGRTGEKDMQVPTATRYPVTSYSVATMECAGAKITVWDVCAHPLWCYHMGEIGGVIIVVNPVNIGEAKDTMRKVVASAELANAALLIIVNSQGRPWANADEVAATLGLHQQLRPWHAVCCSALTGDGLLAALDWLASMRKEAVHPTEPPLAADSSSDIWGLGLVVHEVITGSLPSGLSKHPREVVQSMVGPQGLVHLLSSPDPEHDMLEFAFHMLGTGRIKVTEGDLPMAIQRKVRGCLKRSPGKRPMAVELVSLFKSQCSA
eukprot:TRINITY_DN25640_c0_g1_i1.p1 TRINITY_DN25640_c0_g1~~TRINITY_DN25640_c0_g1_i1.p1  ORF type:complete len:334 (+),score=79.49 TRINITY_DN25640_c0_g1_i1:64-1065(+)